MLKLNKNSVFIIHFQPIELYPPALNNKELIRLFQFDAMFKAEEVNLKKNVTQ